ncbi:MAG TPA: efflux RND transporter periplasmic adaptor subunit [Cytophagaceae bacterium]|jgi:cobalt-zinc-cadmium efflux system membrane fusion protein
MKKYIVVLAILVSALLSHSVLNAHEGEDHGAPKTQKTASTGDLNEVEVLKETQFLFNMRTEITQKSAAGELTSLLGTIVPSSKGLANILAPQSGRITSLKVTVGQKVKAGELLAVMEQNLTAPEQIQLGTERAAVYAEYHGAKKEYERLQKIADIVAKKDLINAEIRFKQAAESKAIFDRLSLGNNKGIPLTAPISGIIDNFNLAVGSSVEAGQPVLRVVDTKVVWVEAQVYEQDREKIQQSDKYIVESAQQEYHSEKVKFVSISQIVTESNQSMKVILVVDNDDQYFKPGQFVNIKVRGLSGNSKIRVRTSAISEIAGKPVIFTHTQPEIFRANYISPGTAEGDYTIIEKGLEPNQRVVVSGAYQLKSIFLNK